jgi:hypothetical protein
MIMSEENDFDDTEDNGIYRNRDSERMVTLDSILNNYEKRHSSYLRIYFRCIAGLLAICSIMMIVNLFIPLLVIPTIVFCVITTMFLLVFVKDELLLRDVKSKINSLYGGQDGPSGT